MPKKVSARHQAQRPQPKKKDVMLVRASSVTGVVESAGEETEEKTTTAIAKAGAPRAKAALTKTTPTKTLERRPESAVKSGSQPARPLSAAQRASRSTQRPAQRLAVGRQSDLVTPEHYRYVLKDLRLIGILAAIMFGTIIALAFVLPHFLTYSS